MKKAVIVLITAALCTVARLPASRAQSDPFYKGKQIKIIVGFTAGGIVDLWARLIGQHLGKQISGQPDIIVQNVPGGGSLIAANQLYNIAKPDGLTLAMVSAALFFDQLTGRPEVKFDWTKFNWIGSPVKNFETLSVRADSPFKTIDDIRSAAQPPRCGSTGTGNTGHYFPQFVEEALGAKFQMIIGYQGTRDIELAFERGEVNCYAVTKEVFEREPARTWLKNHFLRVLVQGGQKRDANFADVPTIYELMNKYKTPEATRRLASVLLSPTAFGRPLLAPPNLPPERLKLLRDAYAKMLADHDFLADTKKRDWEVERISGDELEAMAKKAVGQTPETIEKLKKVLSE
jgi:tripartite-type tricarboxylate transporter receptor subunit TctC